MYITYMYAVTAGCCKRDALLSVAAVYTLGDPYKRKKSAAAGVPLGLYIYIVIEQSRMTGQRNIAVWLRRVGFFFLPDECTPESFALLMDIFKCLPAAFIPRVI